MKKIMVVGSLNVDLTVYTPRFPCAGETLQGHSLVIGVGGKGNNQATAAHRCGAEVEMVGCLGADAMGDVLTRHYQAEGMSQEYLTVAKGFETGTATIEVEDGGQNSIVIVRGANAALTAVQVQAAELSFAKCDAVLTQLETELEPIYEAKRLAQKYHKIFLLNPAPYRTLPAQLLQGINWFTPNETEAGHFAGLEVKTYGDARLAAKKLLEMGIENVVITLGKQGAYYTNGSKEYLVAPPKVKAVDTTGAGDTFNGALSVALAENMPVKEALYFANCAAAISVTRKGAALSAPQRAEIEELQMQQAASAM